MIDKVKLTLNGEEFPIVKGEYNISNEGRTLKVTGLIPREDKTWRDAFEETGRFIKSDEFDDRVMVVGNLSDYNIMQLTENFILNFESGCFYIMDCQMDYDDAKEYLNEIFDDEE